ncbi:DUF3977 family protein [Bacillus sp. JJ722]|uniref:DUF3977 family protein n=1 Tax=Bacillus sp. JJ722 TaxID=3122973 RepID=UPI002FFF7A87
MSTAILWGNTWFIRTEIELEDGTEYEEKRIVKPIKFHSIYLRVWVGKNVIIVDLKEGIKKQKKNRNEFRIFFGIVSY